MRATSRRLKEDASHNRWLVSYSDFIMLLFAFFVVLFASSYRNNRAIPVVSRAVHSGFQDMGAFSSVEAAPEPSEESGDNAGAISESTKAANVEQHSAISNSDLLLLQRQLEAAMGKELRNHEVMMRPAPEGFVISLNEVGFFDSGEASLLPGAAQKIKRIARVLSSCGFSVRIEGHSDNQPIHNERYRSNWDLSMARAMAVLSFLLEDSSFDPAKLSVAGYGEYRPVASNDAPAGRRLNRRVDLVVVATIR